MKNSRKYQKKIRKLLSAMENSAAAPPVDPDPFEVMIEAIVAADASAKQTEKGLAGLAAEFVDFNELRVAPVKEAADALGKGHPRAKEKAREIVTILNGIFSRRNTLSLEYAEKMTKRDLRRHLAELGLSPYASACLTMKVFHGHAIPVDETLVECLEMDRRVEPGSSIEDVQSFLERMILQKDGLAAHECFRNYVAKSARALARKRKADAEAKAKAEAEAKAKAEAEAKAKAEAEAAAKARKRRAKAKARRAKRAAGKAAKTRRKAAKPAAKRAATKKTARSRKKAPSRRSAKNRKARK